MQDFIESMTALVILLVAGLAAFTLLVFVSGWLLLTMF